MIFGYVLLLAAGLAGTRVGFGQVTSAQLGELVCTPGTLAG